MQAWQAYDSISRMGFMFRHFHPQTGDRHIVGQQQDIEIAVKSNFVQRDGISICAIRSHNLTRPLAANLGLKK